MRRTIPNILLRVAIVLFALQHGAPSRAQTPRRACTGIGLVAAVPSQPFVAEYVWTDQYPGTARETVARDSNGRIRIELRRNGAPQDPEQLKKLGMTDEGLTAQAWQMRSVATIFNCNAGTILRLQIEGLLAELRRMGRENPADPDSVSFSAPFLPGSDAKIPANVRVEQLGNREMEGFFTIGVKTTTLGTEKDGEWNGKPISETELWASEDLSLQLLKITKDFRSGAQSVFEVTGIKRIEPDPTLFELPVGYKMNTSEMEAFEVRPGISLTMQLGSDHRACQAQFQPTETLIHRGMSKYMNSETVAEILEELVPARARGKDIGGASIRTSCGAMEITHYENAWIGHGMSMCVSSESYRDFRVSVIFTRAACPAVDHPFGISFNQDHQTPLTPMLKEDF
jgi:hypothetical protein